MILVELTQVRGDVDQCQRDARGSTDTGLITDLEVLDGGVASYPSSSGGTGGIRSTGVAGLLGPVHRTVRAVGQSPMASKRRLLEVAGSDRTAVIVHTS
jgi:hypothetical protein